MTIAALVDAGARCEQFPRAMRRYRPRFRDELMHECAGAGTCTDEGLPTRYRRGSRHRAQVPATRSAATVGPSPEGCVGSRA